MGLDIYAGTLTRYYSCLLYTSKRLCNDMTELLEKKLARYLNEH